MLFLEFECSPRTGSEAATEYGGAFVTCWIDTDDQPEAEAIAREVIEGEGWEVVSFNEAYPVTREVYDDGHSPEGLAHFEQAAEDGDCFSFHMYPIGAEDDV